MYTAAGNQMVLKGGRRRDRRIEFDLRSVRWIPSSQDCQRKTHDKCEIRSCGCDCHKWLTFYTKRKVM